MKSYIGKRCWQTTGYTRLRVGEVAAQKMKDKWLLVLVNWDNSPTPTWEKILNVSFEDIPKLKK